MLEQIDKIGVDRVFCLGDILMAGYDPNGTAQKILNIKNLEIIQGNTDKMVAHYSEELFEKAKNKFK